MYLRVKKYRSTDERGHTHNNNLELAEAEEVGRYADGPQGMYDSTFSSCSTTTVTTGHD